ncbi:MAG: hypothetical protein AB7F50_04385 [Fimbriimonadaceae bacterium]
MVLLVSLERLPEEVRARFANETVYLCRISGRTQATASGGQVIVQAESDEPINAVRAKLESEGLTVAEGRWVVDEEANELDQHRPIHLAAIGYRSSDGRPGVWVEAYHHEPIVGEVIDRFYDEMCTEGHAGNVSQEEFERIVGPTVVVISPDALQQFAARTGKD